MESDIKGCVNIDPGQEQYEAFSVGPSNYLQYDYRSSDTFQLFTGIFRGIEEARDKRDAWLLIIGAKE